VHLSYSIPTAIRCATTSPYTSSIHAKATSIPALTPDDVQTFPSLTHLVFATQSTRGPSAVISLQAILFVVARFPSRTPARAARPEPVQTVIKCCRRG
jgi:hypothetical protein